MCEKCGFSGCNHDWKRWQPKRYAEGYYDAANDRPANPPELMLGNSGYMAGFEQAERDYGKHNLTKREVGLPTTSPDVVESCGQADEREDSNPLFYGSR